jgi:hypothetical protein
MPDDLSESIISSVKTGEISLNARFSTALNAPIYIVIYAEYDDVVEIDKYGNVVAPNF